MSLNYVYSGWACIDCIYVEANGSLPDYEPDREPWNLVRTDRGEMVILGMFTEDHAEDCTEDRRDSGMCNCEQIDFSRSSCDGCGSPLGGSRDAFTVWTTEEVQS